MTYDEHAHVQKLAAVDLLAFTGPREPRAIVEPGCGTGIYSRLLAGAFPGASILAVDLSKARIEEARRAAPYPAIRFETADAEELPAVRCDLVTSNAAFQWFRDLPRAISRFARMLESGGLLSFSFFGPGTFVELEDAVRAVVGDGARVAASGFCGADELSGALAASFPRWQVEERTYRWRFASLAALLRSIRYTGTRGAPVLPATRWTRGTLARIEERYRERHGRIEASYRVRFCRGER